MLDRGTPNFLHTNLTNISTEYNDSAVRFKKDLLGVIDPLPRRSDS